VVTDWSVERARSGAPGAGRALDPFRSYDTALRARLPTASVALDPFHAIKLCQNTIDAVNRRVQQTPSGTGDGAANRCTASGGCCCAAPSATP